MNALGRQYVKYIIQQNYRFLVLVVVIQILIMQNTVSPANFIMNLIVNGNTNIHFYRLDALLVCICIMAFCVPLYQFRYLMKRSSSDLYLSLPIKREHLFQIQFWTGAGILVATTIIALCCNCLLSLTFTDIFAYSFNILILEGLGLILYALFTWVIMKCNSLFDGIFISIAYTIFPLLVMLTMGIFVGRIVGEILLSNIYGIGDMVSTDVFFLITSFLSTPFTMLAIADPMGLPFASDFKTMAILLLYWLVLGICFYIFARKAYIQRRGEQSGERTKSWMSYPVMIPLMTICILLMLGATPDHFLQILFVFLGYLAVYFFAKRALKVNLFMIVQFLCLLFFTNGLERIVISNQFFGAIQETYAIEETRDTSLSMTYESIYFNHEGEIDSDVKRYHSKEWKDLSGEEKQIILNFHKEVLTYCEARSEDMYSLYQFDREGELATITFSILPDTLTRRTREYVVLSDTGLAYMKEHIQRFEDMGILIEEISES